MCGPFCWYKTWALRTIKTDQGLSFLFVTSTHAAFQHISPVYIKRDMNRTVTFLAAALLSNYRQPWLSAPFPSKHAFITHIFLTLQFSDIAPAPHSSFRASRWTARVRLIKNKMWIWARWCECRNQYKRKEGRNIDLQKKKKKVERKIYALLSVYYLINSVISKTILFMFHLPHQKVQRRTGGETPNALHTLMLK